MKQTQAAFRGVTLVLLMMVIVISALDKLIFAFSGPSIIQSLKLTPTQFGFAGSAFFFLYSVAGICVGFAANRVQTRWILVGMSLVWATSQFMATFAGTFAMLVASRMILGIGTGPATAITQHASFKWFKAEARITASTMIQISLMIGGLIAGACLPLAIARFGWRQSYQALGIVSVAWIVMWLVFGREGNVEDQKSDVAKNQGETSYRRLLLNRTFVTVSLLGFVGYVPSALSFSWLAVYLQGGMGLTPPQVAGYLTLTTVALIVVSLIVSSMSRRALARGASVRNAMVVPPVLGCLFGGIAYVGLHFASGNKPLTLALYFFGSVAINILPPFAFAIVGHICGIGKRGALFAIHNGIVTSAGIVSPYLIGVLVAMEGGSVLAGIQQFFTWFGLLAVGAGFVGLRLIQPERTKLGLAVPELS